MLKRVWIRRVDSTGWPVNTPVDVTNALEAVFETASGFVSVDLSGRDNLEVRADRLAVIIPVGSNCIEVIAGREG